MDEACLYIVEQITVTQGLAVQSARNALAGSTLVAHRAGTKAATSDTSNRIAQAPPIASGSVGLTSNRTVSSNRDAPSAITTPAAAPSPTTTSACASTSQRTRVGAAPSAIRM